MKSSAEGTILITGGSGYIGRRLRACLLRSGKIVLDISQACEPDPGCLCIQGDLTDKDGLERLLDGYSLDCVVHLASLLNTNSRIHPVKAVQVNIGGSLNLMELCVERGARRFIYGSSYNAMGTLSGTERVDEETPAVPDEFYGVTKRFVEQMGLEIAHKYALPFIAARIPVVVGPGEPSPTSAWRTDLFNRIRTGGEIRIGFTPDQFLPIAHCEDVAGALACLVLAESPQHTLYNLPHERVQASDLKKLLEKINPGLRVHLGDSQFSGIPAHVSTERFSREFNYRLTPLKDRLKAYQELP